MREKHANAFKLLHLEPNRDQDRIRRAYKKRVQQLHPDRSADNNTPERLQEFQDVLNAYKTLREALKDGQLDPAPVKPNPEPKSAEPARPVVGNPGLGTDVVLDEIYQTKKPVSAVRFVLIVAVTIVLFVGCMMAMMAWQHTNSAPRQWDPTVHEKLIQDIRDND